MSMSKRNVLMENNINKKFLISFRVILSVLFLFLSFSCLLIALFFNEDIFEAGFLGFLLCASYCVVCSQCIIQSKLLNTERVYLNNLKRYLEGKNKIKKVYSELKYFPIYDYLELNNSSILIFEDNSICIIYYGEDKKLFEEIIFQHKTKDCKEYKGYWLN